jgi:hypothetical protein
VKSSSREFNDRIADTIEKRSPAGRHDSVQGWHNMLKSLLIKMGPYLRAGHLVTFQTLKDDEKSFFEGFHPKITVPATASALFIPPSVLYQMLYNRSQGAPQPIPDFSPDNPPDQGIVLASRSDDYNRIVNALFARPPFTPAVDVYESGQLLAGYVYSNIGDCIENLSNVLKVHLQKSD